MTELNDRKFIGKKVTNDSEYKEELTYAQISEMLLSGGFMTMLKRMQVGEVLYYNEKKIEFQRIV